jgi:tetratricopeptide (TPR) repeat protein
LHCNSRFIASARLSRCSASSVQKNPNAVTARSILDNGAQRITTDLKEQPLAQSRLSATIALAFLNIGLYDEAIDVIDTIAAISGIPLALSYQIKADALLKKGEFAYAMETSLYARSLAEKESSYQDNISRPKVLADIARIQGDIHYELAQHNDSLTAYELALMLLNDMPIPDKMEKVRVLQVKALLLSDMGQTAYALSELDKAFALAQESVDETHSSIGMILLAKAQVNFLNWDLEPAKEQINLAISNIQNIVENDNPNLADAISMKGQILHAMGELDEADAALTQAVDIYTKAYGGRHHLSGIAEIYLALIAGDRKDLAGSLAHFDEAKLHYDEGYGQIHANHGDLMVNRASVLASMGEVARAKLDCTNGMVILRDTLGADAPFTQQLQEVCDDIYTR